MRWPIFQNFYWRRLLRQQLILAKAVLADSLLTPEAAPGIMSARTKSLCDKIVAPTDINSTLLAKTVRQGEPSSAPSTEWWNPSVRQKITESASSHILIRVPSSSVSTSRDNSYRIRNVILSSASSNKSNHFQFASMVLKTTAIASLVSTTRIMTRSA